MASFAFLNPVGAGILLVLAWLTLLWGAISDIKRRIVPDTCSIIFLAFWVLHWMLVAELDSHAVLLSLAYAFGVFLAGFALWFLGGLGAGDVKWLSALSLWAGSVSVDAVISLLLITLLSGGLLAFFCLLCLCFARRDAKLTLRQSLRRFEMPYAVAIATAGAVIAWQLYGSNAYG